MNEALADPAQRVFPATGPEASSQGSSRHLSETSLPHPLFQALWPHPQNGVAFRMGDHRLQTSKQNLMQRLVHRRRDRILIEFHEEEIALIDAILPGVLAQRPQILRVEMKIAARADFQPVTNSGPQLISNMAHMRELEIVVAVEVRRRNNVRDSISDGRFRHGNGFLHGGRAVIQTRQNVTVQINHLDDPSLAPPCLQCLPHTEQDQDASKSLAHASRLDFLRQDPPRDAAQKYARDQQQPGFPR